MNKHVCIVTAGDPNNERFNYGQVYDTLRLMLESQGFTVTKVKSAGEGISKLNADEKARYEEKKKASTQMFVAYISAAYCEEALKLAKLHGPRIKFVVYSVGLAPTHMPTFAFRGMLTKETVNAIFD
jgi:hypothetical protein